jgi:probable rRNA maturation factor
MQHSLLGQTYNFLCISNIVCPAVSIELSVVLCDDAYITELNEEWRGKASATDVLSFPAADWDDLIPHSPLALGDVVISLDTAQKQAAEQG